MSSVIEHDNFGFQVDLEGALDLRDAEAFHYDIAVTSQCCQSSTIPRYRADVADVESQCAILQPRDEMSIALMSED